LIAIFCKIYFANLTLTRNTGLIYAMFG